MIINNDTNVICIKNVVIFVKKNMTNEEINTLENKLFRLECEIIKWRMFRKSVEELMENNIVFGKNTNEEVEKVKEQLESIKYY